MITPGKGKGKDKGHGGGADISAMPKKPDFTRQQIAEDTDLSMRGRQPRHGFVPPDDDMQGEPGAETQGQDQSEVSEMEALKQENVELKSRLEKIEAHLGIKGDEEGDGTEHQEELEQEGY